jgi:hypothetical protein
MSIFFKLFGILFNKSQRKTVHAIGQENEFSFLSFIPSGQPAYVQWKKINISTQINLPPLP